MQRENPGTGAAVRRLSMLHSDGGTNWDRRTILEQDPDDDPIVGEIAGAWARDGRIVALVRDDKREYGHPLQQVVSQDNGETWSDPEGTNIPPNGHWGCAPELRYNEKHDRLIALNTDRYSRSDERNSLFIYTARPSEIVEDPCNWTLHDEIPRPMAMAKFDRERPLNQDFYGYPTVAPLNEDEYLVVLTDRAIEDGETADLYSLRISLV
jgi:hypothetical protein